MLVSVYKVMVLTGGVVRYKSVFPFSLTIGGALKESIFSRYLYHYHMFDLVIGSGVRWSSTQRKYPYSLLV
jgi:hypothetical protein